jgi:hypothetical protein
LILLNSDCGSATTPNQFTTSIQKLGGELFPGREFRDLPANHPIFTNEQYPASAWKSKVVLRGLSNGVRELMILMPTDPARAWQLQQTGGSGRLEAFQSVDDIVLYATDKQNLKVKGDSYLATADPSIKPIRTVNLARLQYDGNWDPEPGGWDQLSAVIHNRNKVDVSLKTVAIGKGMLEGFKLAHLTGTTKLILTEPQQQELVKYVQSGGTLLVDAAGGSTEFAESAKPLLEKMFAAGQPLPAPLPPTDPLFTAANPKAQVGYRQFARTILGSLKAPRLIALKINGRNAVYFSREDLSAGLVGESIDGIIGYDPQAAADIVSGVILSSSDRP